MYCVHYHSYDELNYTHHDWFLIMIYSVLENGCIHDVTINKCLLCYHITQRESRLINMFFILSQAWDKEKILSPCEESDSVL